MQSTEFESGKDPLSLVEQRPLVKALRKFTEIDRYRVWNILNSPMETYKEAYDSTDILTKIEKSIKNLSTAIRDISSLEGQEIFIETGIGKHELLPMLEDSEVESLEKLKKRLEKKLDDFNNSEIISPFSGLVQKESHKKNIRVTRLYDYIYKKTEQINKLYDCMDEKTKSMDKPFSKIAIYELIADLVSLKGVSSCQYNSKQVKKFHENDLERRKQFPNNLTYQELKKSSKK